MTTHPPTHTPHPAAVEGDSVPSAASDAVIAAQHPASDAGGPCAEPIEVAAGACPHCGQHVEAVTHRTMLDEDEQRIYEQEERHRIDVLEHRAMDLVYALVKEGYTSDEIHLLLLQGVSYLLIETAEARGIAVSPRQKALYLRGAMGMIGPWDDAKMRQLGMELPLVTMLLSMAKASTFAARQKVAEGGEDAEEKR